MKIVRLASTVTERIYYMNNAKGEVDFIEVSYSPMDAKFDLFAVARRKFMEKKHWEKGWSYYRRERY